MTELDDQDREILRIIQKDARISSEAIGEMVNLSAASVHRRLRRWREEGVIEREAAILNAKALGAPMTILVSVVMEREHVDVMNAFANRMRVHPNVQQCYMITGEADFLLIVKVRDMEDFEQFCEEAFHDRQSFRKFNSSIVMSTVKAGLSAPV
ncbi:MAG: Lrp/AsnC family transcriptional regulator [Pseudomonadota bacterium]